MSQFKIHDVVIINKIDRENPDKSWYGAEYIGVITDLQIDSETDKIENVYLRNEYGEGIRVVVKDAEKHYYTISNLSESEFKMKIFEVSKQKLKSISELLEEKEKVDMWYEEFTQNVSLFHKLRRFLME